MTAWNKGLKTSEEVRHKQSIAHLGKKHSCKMDKKLNFKLACQIRHDYDAMSTNEIAIKYNVSCSTIKDILHNRTYRVKSYTDQEIQDNTRDYKK